ncbi:MAG: hypothetical protein Q8P12_00245 [bacterium]|nr:hypothetical protein [bacterium]
MPNSWMWPPGEGSRESKEIEREERSAKQRVLPHYYGDTVRKLFLAGSIIMLLSFALFAHMLPFSHFLPILAILLLGTGAGWVSPAQRLVTVMNVVIAGVSFAALLYLAAFPELYDHVDWHEQVLQGISVVLAVIFFFAFYYGIKTLRGFFFKR